MGFFDDLFQWASHQWASGKYSAKSPLRVGMAISSLGHQLSWVGKWPQVTPYTVFGQGSLDYTPQHAEPVAWRPIGLIVPATFYGSFLYTPNAQAPQGAVEVTLAVQIAAPSRAPWTPLGAGPWPTPEYDLLATYSYTVNGTGLGTPGTRPPPLEVLLAVTTTPADDAPEAGNAAVPSAWLPTPPSTLVTMCPTQPQGKAYDLAQLLMNTTIHISAPESP